MPLLTNRERAVARKVRAIANTPKKPEPEWLPFADWLAEHRHETTDAGSFARWARDRRYRPPNRWSSLLVELYYRRRASPELIAVAENAHGAWVKHPYREADSAAQSRS